MLIDETSDNLSLEAEESSELTDAQGVINTLYNQLKLHKTYCSSMQSKYRALTSTWLLAAFLGIGYVLSRDHQVVLPFNIFLAVIVLSFLGSFGITLLWFLDVVLYQRLWLACVVELARLEHKHRWLPRINLNILEMRRSKRFRFFQSYFYVGINSAFVAISSVTAIVIFGTSIAWSSAVLFASALAIYLMTKLMLLYSGEMIKADLHSFR
jgi:hypothetical protein